MKCLLTRFAVTLFVTIIFLFNVNAQVVFPLKASANGHYLVDQNNKPFPILGRTAWFIISQPPEGYKAFIENCISHGCNSIEMHVLDHDPRGNRPPFNGNGDLPFLKCLDGSTWKGSLVYKDAKIEAPDLTTPNEKYWRFVDTFLSYCESKGIMVFFFPAYLGYPHTPDGWMDELVANGISKDEAYGAWIANRYKNQKNIVWMILGDRGIFTEPQKIAEDALIKGLKSVPDQQSIFYSAEGNGGQSSRDQIDFGSEMTLNGLYSWDNKHHSDDELSIPELGRKAYSQTPLMPAYLLEEPYDEEGPDGNNFNPNAIQPVRRFQWWGWLSSVGGYIAGNGYVWPFISPIWQQHLETPGARDMILLNRFIKSYHWWELVPSGLDGMKTLIVSGGSKPSDSDYVAASAAPSGNLLIAYIPPAHKGSITVDMSVMKGKITAKWYDPSNGDYKKITGSPFANKGNHQFTPPGKNKTGENDWVLVLEAKGSYQKETTHLQEPINKPLRISANPNYFENEKGKAIILCGSHTWNTLQDWGTNGKVQPLNFHSYVNFLQRHGHNFTLLWFTELPSFHNLPTTESNPPDFTVSPFPWKRTGPGKATDGGLKFDLTKFNENYFKRLRQRVKTLNDAGIYAGVYLFTAEFVFRFRFAHDGYPFTGANNINGIDDGYKGGSAETGLASFCMTAPNVITDIQDVYVKRVIDELNDLPNILWIVSEEAPGKSTWWNNHLISLVHEYEKNKIFQHPVGYAVPENNVDSIIFNSDADWIAPSVKISPAKSCGNGNPKCKVDINDSDHSYWEMWKESPQDNRNYAWENFLNGNQVLFMDPYLVYYPRERRNLCNSPVNGVCKTPDPRWENFRNNLDYILKYSRKVNLANLTPDSSLCSTKYCLAQTPTAGAEYLIYAPHGNSFTADLSAMSHSRMLAVEWFNPATGETIVQSPIAAGSHAQSFSPPFSGDAVLYLVDVKGHK